MRPLARRTPKDWWRGPRAYSPDEPREFLMGAPRIHGESLKLGFRFSQATVSRYLPRRGYPPAQTWRTFLRNQAFGIVAIGLGEASRRSAELLVLVRGWIARGIRCATNVRNGIPCRIIEPSSTLHRLQPYRQSYLIGVPFMVLLCPPP
jgi:hypothetical protein